MDYQKPDQEATEEPREDRKGRTPSGIATISDPDEVESPNLGQHRPGKTRTLRIPIGYLYGRTIREAGAQRMDPNALALDVVLHACGLHNPPPDGWVELVPGDHIHPRSPLMYVHGPLVDAVRAAARSHGTCASRFITWRLGVALEEPYQRSVLDLI
jgi:hypothetical protein